MSAETSTETSLVKDAAKTAGIVASPPSKQRRVVTVSEGETPALVIKTTVPVSPLTVIKSSELPDPRFARGFDKT